MNNSEYTTKTLKVRVKDKHKNVLCQMAKNVNFVWNYLNELSHRNIVEHKKFLSNYDLQKYTNGSAKELGLHSQTIQSICKEYATRRKQFKKQKLKWRKTFGSRRSLGWIPINSKAASWVNGQVYFNKQYYSVFDSYELSKYEFKNASFNEDARGRWYFNVVVEVPRVLSSGQGAVGVDLGFKASATASDGSETKYNQVYRQYEKQLKVQQRANNKKRVRNIHAKIANIRKDSLHKFTTNLVKNFSEIYVGDLSIKKMLKAKRGKSTLDAGFGLIRSMLKNKCDNAGILLDNNVDERDTTRTCHLCKSLTGPKGLDGLRIREWKCDVCGGIHQRDVNAAINILAVGHGRLAEGISLL
jgi:IS605 OrfB family transposase